MLVPTVPFEPKGALVDLRLQSIKLAGKSQGTFTWHCPPNCKNCDTLERRLLNIGHSESKNEENKYLCSCHLHLLEAKSGFY